VSNFPPVGLPAASSWCSCVPKIYYRRPTNSWQPSLHVCADQTDFPSETSSCEALSRNVTMVSDGGSNQIRWDVRTCWIRARGTTNMPVQDYRQSHPEPDLYVPDDTAARLLCPIIPRYQQTNIRKNRGWAGRVRSSAGSLLPSYDNKAGRTTCSH
jgi:hypothetical protein